MVKFWIYFEGRAIRMPDALACGVREEDERIALNFIV